LPYPGDAFYPGLTSHPEQAQEFNPAFAGTSAIIATLSLTDGTQFDACLGATERDGSPLGQAAHAGVSSVSAGYFDNTTTQFTVMSVAGSDRVGGGP